MSRPSLDDYIDVAERIVNFKTEHPDGSLQQLGWEIREIGNQRFVVYTAAAYRTPDDPRPGVGTAWEPFPGTTPYTRNSELMNAETAAWGRAIVALGLTSNRKLASRQEVRARQEEQQQPKSDVPNDWPPKDGYLASLKNPPSSEPVKPEEALTVDEPFAVEIAGRMKAMNILEPVPFREFMGDFDVECPSDLRSKEARWAVLRGLTLEKALEVSRVLVEREKALTEAAA